MTSAATPLDPAMPRLRRNAVGITGAVIMSAAIMGPAVSTFFNPQFSTPFSGAATPFVYLACLVCILITASGAVPLSNTPFDDALLVDLDAGQRSRLGASPAARPTACTWSATHCRFATRSLHSPE